MDVRDDLVVVLDHAEQIDDGLLHDLADASEAGLAVQVRLADLLLVLFHAHMVLPKHEGIISVDELEWARLFHLWFGIMSCFRHLLNLRLIISFRDGRIILLFSHANTISFLSHLGKFVAIHSVEFLA